MANRQPAVFDADSIRALREYSGLNKWVQCDVQRQVTSAKSASGGTTKTPKIVGSYFVRVVNVPRVRPEVESIDTAGLGESYAVYSVYFDVDADVDHDDRLISTDWQLEVIYIDEAASSRTQKTVVCKAIE